MNQSEQEEKSQGPDPTDLVPVLRHHLHEALLVIDMAASKSGAEDMVAGYRDELTVTKPSRLTNSLNRVYNRLIGYLDLEENNDDISENE